MTSTDLLALSIVPVPLVSTDGRWTRDHERAAVAGFIYHSRSGDCGKRYPAIYGPPRELDERHRITEQRIRRFVQHGNTRGAAGIA